jgi:hypothetical protein
MVDDSLLAARELGLSMQTLHEVHLIVQAARLPQRLRIDDVELFPDLAGRPYWEVSLSGAAFNSDGSNIEFRFQLNMIGHKYQIASSHTPDWFKVRTAGRRVLFEGNVEHPANNEDSAGWARYNVFSPVRRIVEETELAVLLTQRPACFDVTLYD